MFAFVEMMIFLAILVAGYVYVWVKGDLDWDRPRPRYINYVQNRSKEFESTTSSRLEVK